MKEDQKSVSSFGEERVLLTSPEVSPKSYKQRLRKRVFPSLAGVFIKENKEVFNIRKKQNFQQKINKKKKENIAFVKYSFKNLVPFESSYTPVKVNSELRQYFPGGFEENYFLREYNLLENTCFPWEIDEDLLVRDYATLYSPYTLNF